MLRPAPRQRLSEPSFSSQQQSTSASGHQGSFGGVGGTTNNANPQTKVSSSSIGQATPDATIFFFLSIAIQSLDFFTTTCTGITSTNFFKFRDHRFIVEYILGHYVRLASKLFVPTEALLYLLVEVHIYQQTQTSSKSGFIPQSTLKDVVGEYISKMVFCLGILWIWECFFDWKGIVFQSMKIPVCFLGQYVGSMIWSWASLRLGLRRSQFYKRYVSRMFGFKKNALPAVSLPG